MGDEVQEHNVRNGNTKEAATITREQESHKASGGDELDVERNCHASNTECKIVATASSDIGDVAGKVPVGCIQLQNEALTPREQEKLDAFIRARSMTNAAKELGIRTDTLRDSLRNIRDKLGVECNADLFPEGVTYKRSTVNSVTAGALLELLETQEYRCALSGVSLTPDNAVVDHTRPRKDGGKHEMANLQWLHSDVNRMKGTLTQSEFMALCRRVAAWTS